MFFNADRIPAVREMIVATTTEQRKKALAKLLPMQRGDFEGIFRAMKGKPVTIRLLDPHCMSSCQKRMTISAPLQGYGSDLDNLKATVQQLQEVNPMMGMRGCRLPIVYPEIGEMQAQAIIEAAINVSKETGELITPEIMVPLVGSGGEIRFVKKLITTVADGLIAKSGLPMKYLVGTMIELPRAAVSADRIAVEAEFFSFGTNDLTQMSYGLSRDDAGKFLPTYLDKRFLSPTPLKSLTFWAPDALWRMAVKRQGDPARSAPGRLRRTWRRSLLRGIFPQSWPRLCVLLTLPRADCASCGGTGRHQVPQKVT